LTGKKNDRKGRQREKEDQRILKYIFQGMQVAWPEEERGSWRDCLREKQRFSLIGYAAQERRRKGCWWGKRIRAVSYGGAISVGEHLNSGGNWGKGLNYLRLCIVLPGRTGKN